MNILKTGYILGSVADIIFGVLLIAFPSVCLNIYGNDAVLSPDIRFWMAYAGIAIFTWTGFLVWGMKQLKERKSIALVTAFVVTGFMIVQSVGLFYGIGLAVNMIPLFVMQFILIALFLVGYAKA